jgi:myo-inositol-1(or 4)-monophosphatase
VDITVRFAASAIDVVRATAIEEILPRYRSVVSDPAGALQPRQKDDGSLVTEADFAAQRALIRKLTALENVPVLGEEMRGDEQAKIWEQAACPGMPEAGGRFWCVDPLDGTRNFMGGIPHFAVSVALMEGREPVFGVIYDPIADEAFYAVRGAGAWLNHKPLVLPSTGPQLSAAIAEVSLRKEAAGLRNLLKHRRPYAKRLTSGSSTLSWCHLAAARTDVFVHSGQMAWDYAAGALILSEAGGALATFDDDDFWKSEGLKRSVIAARTPRLFDQWRDWIRENLQ